MNECIYIHTYMYKYIYMYIYVCVCVHMGEKYILLTFKALTQLIRYVGPTVTSQA